MFSSALNAVTRILLRQKVPGLPQAAFKGQAFAEACLLAQPSPLPMDCALLSRGFGCSLWQLNHKPGCHINDANSTWGLRGVLQYTTTPESIGARSVVSVRSFQTALQSQQAVTSTEKKGVTVHKRSGPSVAVTMEEALALQGLSLFRTPQLRGGLAKKHQGARQIKEKAADSEGEGKDKAGAVVHSTSTAAGAATKEQENGPTVKSDGKSTAEVSKLVKDKVGRHEKSSGAVRGAPESNQESVVALEVISKTKDSLKKGAKPAAKRNARTVAANGAVDPACAVTEAVGLVKEVPNTEGFQNELTLESSIEDALEWCCRALGRAPGEAEQQLVREADTYITGRAN